MESLATEAGASPRGFLTCTSNARGQAALLEARARVLGLEGEVRRLRQQLTTESVEKEGFSGRVQTTPGGAGENNGVLERIRKVW